MNKPSSLIWMVFILLLIVPTPAGKFIVDLAGGIFLILTIIPLILGGVGWLAWKRIQSKLTLQSLMSFAMRPGWVFNYLTGKRFELSNVKKKLIKGQI